ncbi:MAG TPA: alpha/beta fold hydrolase [Fluviicoccus sp.]|nr:alpha/beta fold hydrolase [Fluviicoccus sp.]
MRTPAFPHAFFPSPFRPARGLANPHLQTVFATFHRRTPPSLDREVREITLPDGDHILLDCHTPARTDPDAPLTLIVHGLGGSSDSHYVLGLQKALAELGWPSAAMNCRGSRRPNQATRAYHAGASDDVIAVMAALTVGLPRRIALVGYSLGGSMVLKALSELGDDPRLFGGVAVSVPLDLARCADRMDRGLSRLYRKHLLDGMSGLWLAKLGHFRQTGKQEEARLLQRHVGTGRFSSFWEFDQRVMAPLHGFRDVHDYYRRCTPNQFLKDIQAPTLIIHSTDDPFMDPGVVPDRRALSSAVHFELAERGGHVGFIGGSVRAPVYYLEQRIPEFLTQLRQAGS